MKESIDLIYNSRNQTYKIFLKPYAENSGDLFVINPIRMLKRNTKKHHELFGDNIDKYNISEGFEYYSITNIKELFNTLCNSKPNATFSYCYKSDGRLYLCKTTGPDDSNCKHVFLCNKLWGIVCAGIVQFSKKDGKIYMDGASGTYKSKARNLYTLKADFENSFPGINIELIIDPYGNKESREKYCSLMTNESPDYKRICGLLSHDKKKKTRKRKTNKRKIYKKKIHKKIHKRKTHKKRTKKSSRK